MTYEVEQRKAVSIMTRHEEESQTDYFRRMAEWAGTQKEDPWVLDFWQKERLGGESPMGDKHGRMRIKYSYPLMYALIKQDYAALENVLLRGADPNEQVEMDVWSRRITYLPLSVAACLNDRRAAEILLRNGADPNTGGHNPNGDRVYSVLAHAASQQVYGVADALLNAGALVVKSAYWYWKHLAYSPIYFAVRNGDVQMLTRLLSHLQSHTNDTLWIAEYYYSVDWSDGFIEDLLSDEPTHAQALQMLLQNPSANNILTEWRHSNGCGLRGILESKGASVLLQAVRDFNALLQTESDKAMMLGLRNCFFVDC
jgi:hypothetical protein